MNFDFNIFAGQPGLPTLWFVAIGVFLIMYMILDGFDLGVGMLMGSKFAKNEKETPSVANIIGPVWTVTRCGLCPVVPLSSRHSHLVRVLFSAHASPDPRAGLPDSARGRN